MADPSTPRGLRLWQRFHVRLSAMYGGLVLAVLLSVAGFFYLRGVERELAALQARLRIACRRARAALALTGDVTPAAGRLCDQLRDLAHAASAARDLDVQIAARRVARTSTPTIATATPPRSRIGA